MKPSCGSSLLLPVCPSDWLRASRRRQRLQRSLESSVPIKLKNSADSLSLTSRSTAAVIDAQGSDGAEPQLPGSSRTAADNHVSSDTDGRFLDSSTLKTAAWVVAASLVMGLAETFKAFVSTQAQHQQVPLYGLLEQNIPWWFLWALLCPIAFWLGGRFRLDDREKLAYTLPVHFVAAVVLASLHITAAALIFFHSDLSYIPPAVRATMAKSPREIVLRWNNAFLVMDMVTYGVLLGLFYALDYQRRLRRVALESMELRAESAQLQHRIVEARLHALRMELNPHFLFNALNSISALVRKNDNTAAVNMIAGLGDLLRATLERGSQSEMPLGDELRLVDLYLNIARVRFGDRLKAVVDVPAELRDAMVPTLVLQPIVENAVRHGIGERSGAVSVNISAYRDERVLVLEVADTGAGLSKSDEFELSEGIGLSNTRARLEQLYGRDASLTVSNAPSGGAVARIRMPLQLESKESVSHA